MGKIRSGESLRRYRQSYNYRAEYFKRNPGLFGCIWFCSQCYKPLFGKKNVVIDHIVPLSQGGRNHVSNCTAICEKCNSRKSDKIDGRIVKGMTYKLLESTVFRGQRGVTDAASLAFGVTAGAVNTTARVGKRVVSKTAGTGFSLIKGAVGGTIRLVTYPLRKGSLVSKLFFLVIYVLIILFALNEFTGIFDAWL